MLMGVFRAAICSVVPVVVSPAYGLTSQEL